MKLAKVNKIDIFDKDRFSYKFEIYFEGACDLSYEELISYAENEYGSLKEMFKDVEVFWNDAFDRIEFERNFGNGWLGFLTNGNGGIFSYIENTDYEVLDVYAVDFHKFIMELSIPKIYKSKN